MQRGRFEAIEKGAVPSAVVVFDDGLVVLGPGGKTRFVAAFGGIGAAAAILGARKVTITKLVAIDGLGGAATAVQAAAAVNDARLVPASEVQNVKLASGKGETRTLTMTTESGTLSFFFQPEMTAVVTVVRLLQPLFGDRFEIDPAASFAPPPAE